MENKNIDILGKVLFILSILLLAYMILSPLAKTIVHIDELWTIGVIGLPLSEGIPLMISDVHPPLYYLVFKLIFKALSVFGIAYNDIFVLKLFSILPYALILIVSATKIKKDYGWLTAGLFAFVLGSLNMFFIQFLTIRMYNWALFFLLMSFIYFKEILISSDRKSWILFTIFSALVAYTQYFILISTVLLYGILLAYILFNKNPEFELKALLKKWSLSVISVIVLYLPWLFIFLGQINHRQHIMESSFPTLMEIVNYFTYFTGISSNLSINSLPFKIFAFLSLILILYLFFREYKKERSIENFYIGSGILLFFLSLIFGVIIVSLAFNMFTIRYLVPVGSVFWLAVCILIGKIDSRKLLIISLVAILIISIIGISANVNSTGAIYDEGEGLMNILDGLNNNDSVIVYTQEFHLINFHNYLNETKEFKTGFYMPYSPKNIKEIKDIEEIKEKYPDKEIYVIKANNFNDKFTLDEVAVDNQTYDEYGKYKKIEFIHVNK